MIKKLQKKFWPFTTYLDANVHYIFFESLLVA